MSDTYSVIYSPEAVDDLREIYLYIAFTLKVPDTAEKQVNRIRKEIRSLNLMPSRYSIVDWKPWKNMKMHKVPVDNFVVYYTVNDSDSTVTVIRIFYGGRDVKNIINSEQD
ncbi:MAG: type II toxin-antitoxin system RelE/ParE family toxin [Bacteroides sp.]|nr:type II toxin-antitoxin system RelE/ParE family toxin [Bacteroides sp.]MCM1548906.1 type II toxin-antitoxin system RelE/ParE family toxin [Clostridium sp.]